MCTRSTLFVKLAAAPVSDSSSKQPPTATPGVEIPDCGSPGVAAACGVELRELRLLLGGGGCAVMGWKWRESAPPMERRIRCVTTRDFRGAWWVTTVDVHALGEEK